ncbi:hypothetical protein HELRODRAFT_110189 [Helobdella robusta]|uniref:Enoyl-CoA delta isomerase 2, mitochondrial n=1 Tax=Helobdella robusta TaxID=6412 RepID=T1EF03_HELRO|nr:hypothetical protein HELRODRAFT_110189 [Helobdella robusta]ESO07875.1 hypothetical protein HELRODRAFT_110189 [Helobdella robusta]
MSTQYVISKVAGKIHKILLNRPTKMNAMTFEMYESVTNALKEAASNDTTIAVITGSGKYFSSGNDLSNFSKIGSTDISTFAQQSGQLLKKFVDGFIDFPKPLLCLVNGHVVGIWVSVLALFDGVYCTKDATFHSPFSLLGQTPEGCSSYTFPRLMGAARANDILMFNKKLSAEDARRDGLVTEVYPSETFEADVWKKVEEISNLYPQTLRDAKFLVRNAIKERLHQVNEIECDVLVKRWQSEECMEAIVNFMTRKSKM